jgi:hypothetical protein
MSELISNCCSAHPTSDEMVIGEICPKCYEHCRYEDVDTNEEIAEELEKDDE